MNEAVDPEALRQSGFDALLVEVADSLISLDVPDVDGLLQRSQAAGLTLLLDMEMDRFAIDHPLVLSAPEAFSLRRQPPDDAPVDPRTPGPLAGEARARLGSRDAARAVFPALVQQLRSLLDAGVGGFRLRRPEAAHPEMLREFLASLKHDYPDCVLIAELAGDPRGAALRLRESGFDHVTFALSHWNFQAPWLADDYEALRTIAPPLAELSLEAVKRSGSDAELERLLLLSAGTATGFILPTEVLDRGTPKSLQLAFELADAAARFDGEMRLFSSVTTGVTALVRADESDFRVAEEAMLLLVNRNESATAAVSEPDSLRYAALGFWPFRPGKGNRNKGNRSKTSRAGGNAPALLPLAPSEVRALFARRAKPLVRQRTGGIRAAREAAGRPRLAFESVSPEVDGGLFPAKRTVGDLVTVEAIFFGDDHEQLAAELRWRAANQKSWTTARMEELGNDRWRASFPLERVGRHEFQIEGWLDRYGGFRRDFKKKLDAGVALRLDFQEGRVLIENAKSRAGSEQGLKFAAFLKGLDQAGDGAGADILLDPALAALMDDVDERPFSLLSQPRLVESERLAASFSSWYELFPRSQTDDPGRHGNFDDVIRRLPAIRAMGFDTLYFPPIHPIGSTHRKGRNNSLSAAPDDPGSPYATGSSGGGHDAIHPELGTFDDFRRLVAAAAGQGLEIALDFAIQCSPDHPWLKKYPGWFDWRPDGTIKYAENPPKKYEDIVNVDFYTKDAIPGLWIALRDVVLFWIGHGVRTFRVDNPHTKPLPFWQWLIDDVRAAHPDVIFLSEAFTRPKLKYHLAKLGFSQSYTYFIWRNSKRELTDYLTELTQQAPREYFRPHFFVNTPDINPDYLQTSGRAGFRIRAALAATLSGLFGVYSGFELCESEPLPDKEEYRDSEKYAVRPRDWEAPGNIIADITALNRLRRAYPALQTHLGLKFYNAWNDNILYYGKSEPDGAEMILVAVTLDPHNAQEADFEIPLWEWGIGDEGSLDVLNLLDNERFRWHGKVQHLRLDPDRPYAIWRVARPGGDG